MTTQYREFIALYEEFKGTHPRHPLLEDLRAGLMKGRFPSDEWLRTRTIRMNAVMRPLWLNSSQAEQETVPDS